MAKNMIIEAQNSNTEFEQSTNKGILGKLAGVFADYSNGTRNGRLYNEQLWDERVFGSEDVQEALETKTLFGELDHPDGDRCETLAQNAAITITKLEKRPDEGVIYGEAEILDTPTGRIVKALADSGAKLGVSSRGMGEEINEDGQNIIDPSSYDFITFDVVVTPANEKARVSLVESKRINKLTESLKKEIKDCETENQLDQVKNVVETININNKDELNKLIEEKSLEINPDENQDDSDNDMVEADNTEKVEESKITTNKNNIIALKIMENKYKELKAELDESLKANEELHEENEKLIESKNQIKKAIKQRETIILENKLREQEELVSGHKELITKMNMVNKRKVENLETKYKNEVKKLNEQLKIEDKRYNKLLEENKKITESIKLNAKLVEDKDLQISKLQEQLNKQTETNSKKLQESKSLQENKVAELNKRIESLLAENKQLKLERDQFTDLAFTPTQGLVSKEFDNLDFNDDFSSEDQALFNALL